ncbi:MAG: TraB/GumN family protein [Flavobacteriales bacterium]
MQARTLLLLICFYSLGFSQMILPEKELLWEVSHPKSKVKSYIFGTLHANDRSLFDLSDSVYVCFDQAPILVLETDIYRLFETMDSRKNLPDTKFDDQGKSYTNTASSSATLYGSEDGMPQFLDAWFQVLGLQYNKQFVPLEALEDQYALTNEFNLSERKIIDNGINAFTQEKLKELYLIGDIEALQRFMKSNLSVQDQLYEQVIVKRNKLMLDKLMELLKGNTSFFCAVGAGHLGGDDGLIQMLRSKGYRVRPVLWSVADQAPKAKQKLKKPTEFIYTHEPSGLVAKFPGKPYVADLEDGTKKIIYRELGQGNTFEIDLLTLDPNISQEEIASIYINPPTGAPITKKILDDGSIVYYGLSDTYPEGLNFVQIQFGAGYFVVLKCYGGNKFMHSNRPFSFFEKVWFD